MENRTALLRGLVILLILILVSAPAFALVFPRLVVPASAAAERFSAQRALQHLPVIAGEPHPSGSAAQKAVTDYLAAQLMKLGLEVDIQKSAGAENVVARLRGSSPTGAIVVLAHTDSVAASPGAADNGSGVAVLLEVARALKARPANANDLIFLFDDSEELPDAFTGSKAFVREHPWMETVKVAISIDTAVGGPISVVETGPENGWLVRVLARAYDGGAWTAMSGGGGYDSTPFRNAGIMVLALEDNYPFREKHTAMDRPEIVKAGSVQQMGGQVLAIIRQLASLDLSQTRGPQETFFMVPLLGFFHYPVKWVLPITVASLVLLALLIWLALRRRMIRISGLLSALGLILGSAAAAAVLITLLLPILPGLFGWETRLWPDWPEVIPPNAGPAFAMLGIVVFAICIGAYRLARRWVNPVDYAIASLIPFALFAAAFGLALPQSAYLFSWPVAIASIVWLALMLVASRMSRPKRLSQPLSAIALTVAAWPAIVLIMPYIPGIIMADGTKSLNILGAILALALASCLPAVDGLVAQRKRLAYE